MVFLGIWILSIIATAYIADQKKRNVGGYCVLAVFTGPIAVIIVAMLTENYIPSSSSSYQVNNLQDAKEQLLSLKLTLAIQEEKLKELENFINKLFDQPVEVPASKITAPSPEPESILAKAIPISQVQFQESSQPVKNEDMELDFGRNWLSKIGIVVLALGVAFLISYTFKYFGPFLKIAFGYLVAGSLFFAGVKLETQEKLTNFGRALLGGAWAIIYFTTYAMYHFEASQIILSQGLDLFLLSVVVIGMMLHTLKYKSEGMMAITLFVAYLTSTIGHITSFTIISNLILAVLVLFFVYKFQWVKILSFGIMMTYAVHYFWVLPNIMSSVQMTTFLGITPSNCHDLMNLIFLTSYWLIFFVGVHLIGTDDDNGRMRTLALTNIGNIALYSVLAYPLILNMFYDQRFIIFLVDGLIYLALALTMKGLNREKMYLSDIVAAVFMITFSISLKFLPDTSLLLWLIEIPLLLFIGIEFKEKVFNYFSYALSVFVVVRILTLELSEGMQDVNVFGYIWPWYGFICFWASISMAVCFCLTQSAKQNTDANDMDLAFDQVFSFASCFYFSIWLLSLIRSPWVAFSLSMEAWAFLVIGILLELRRFKAYAYLAFISSAVMFFCEQIDVSQNYIACLDVLSFFGVYYAVKYFKEFKPSDLFIEYEEETAFVGGLIILIFAIFKYVFFQWISLSLGMASVALIMIGFMSGNKIERMGGMALLALTLGRVVLVDLSGLDIIFKIITLIVLGVLFLGVSYVYNQFNIEKK